MSTVAATSVDPLDPAKIGAHGAALLQRDRWSARRWPSTSESGCAR